MRAGKDRIWDFVPALWKFIQIQVGWRYNRVAERTSQFLVENRSPPFLTASKKKKHDLPVSNIKESTGVHCDISRFTEMLKITPWLKLDSQCEWRLFSTRRKLKNLKHNKRESSCCYVFIPKVCSRLLDQHRRIGLNKTRLLGLNRFATKVLKWIHKFELLSITLDS